MKKIGILTFSRSFNYGAILQMFALYTYLTNKDLQVDIINNYQRKDQSNRTFFQRIRSNIWQYTVRSIFKDYKRINKTQKFKKAMLNYTEFIPNRNVLVKKAEGYDLVIVGSDQVWNPIFAGIDDNWFLFFAKCKKISYAASFGLSKIPEKFIEIYKKGLKNLDKISVREETGKKIIKDIINKDVDVVMDPVFLLNKKEWSDIAIEPRYEKYILCYYMPGFPKVEKKIEELAKYYSKKFNLKIINVGKKEYARLSFFEKNLFGIGLQEFLGLIKNANMIITNSFHGTAFSILFEKQFISVIESNAKNLNLSSRITDLLNRLKMTDFIYDVSIIKDINLYKLASISDLSRKILEQEKQKSVLFLSKSIDE